MLRRRSELGVRRVCTTTCQSNVQSPTLPIGGLPWLLHTDVSPAEGLPADVIGQIVSGKGRTPDDPELLRTAMMMMILMVVVDAVVDAVVGGGVAARHRNRGRQPSQEHGSKVLAERREILAMPSTKCTL